MDQGLDSQGGWITPGLLWSISKSKCKKTVPLENQTFPVRSTARRKLKQIDFQFDRRPATSRTEPRYEVAGQRSEARDESDEVSSEGESMLRSLRRGRCICILPGSGTPQQTLLQLQLSGPAKFAPAVFLLTFPSNLSHRLTNIMCGLEICIKGT
jgi:hypothetical protein